MVEEDLNLKVGIDGADQFSSGMKKIGSSMSDVEKTALSSTTTFSALGGALGGAFGGGMAMAATSAANLFSSLFDLSTVSPEVAMAMTDLNLQLFQMGFDIGPEVADVVETFTNELKTFWDTGGKEGFEAFLNFLSDPETGLIARLGEVWMFITDIYDALNTPFEIVFGTSIGGVLGDIWDIGGLALTMGVIAFIASGGNPYATIAGFSLGALISIAKSAVIPVFDPSYDQGTSTDPGFDIPDIPAWDFNNTNTNTNTNYGNIVGQGGDNRTVFIISNGTISINPETI